MGVALVTAPATLPVTIESQRDQSYANSETDLVTIQRKIAAATLWCENWSRCQFITATYDWTLTGFPQSGDMELCVPRPPLQSVTSINYVDTDGASQLLATSVYDVDTSERPGVIYLKFDQTWPATRAQRAAVTIRFVAGFGDQEAIPENVAEAVHLVAGHLFENREAVIALERGQSFHELPLAARDLLAEHRVVRVA